MFNKTQKTFTFKKLFKIKIKNIRFTKIKLGIAAIRTLQSARLFPDQLEAVRRVFVRATLRMGKIWLCSKINFLETKKSQGSRMGKGVGSTKGWVAEVKVGQILFEFSFVDVKLDLALISMSRKMPVLVNIIFKNFKY